MHRKWMRSALFVSIAAVIGSAAFAAGATTPAAAGSTDTANPHQAKTLGKVVVTAEKSKTDLQKTPVTVTAISGQDLHDQGIDTLVNAATLAPGVSVQQANTGPSFYIRGIGTKVASFGSASPISTYVDGILQDQTPMLAAAMADVSQIEVLRGPQGTIFGRNSTGGAVNVITNDPVLGGLDGTLGITAGNYDTVRSQLMLNLPLSNWAALRVVASTDRHEGYLSNGLDDQNQKYARAKLLLQPTDKLRVLLEVSNLHTGNLGTGNVVTPLDGRGAWTAASYHSINTACSPNCQPYNRVNDTEYSAHVNWDLGFGDLTYLVGHQDYAYTYTQTFSGLWEYNHQPYKQDTDELRLASKQDQPIRWLVGLYYLNASNAGGYDYIHNFGQVTTTQKAIDRSKAAFGQLVFDLADNVHLTTGLRYTHDFIDYAGHIGAPTDLYPASGLTAGRSPFHYFSYRVGLDWEYAPSAMFYTDVSTANKEGGVNQFVGAYKPEHIIAFEVGSKNRFLDDRLQLNTDAYLYHYTNFQLSYPHYLADGNINVYAANVGGTTVVRGLESELDWLVTGNDRLGGSVSYEHSAFGDGVITESCTTSSTGFCPLYLKGMPLPQAPSWSVIAKYEHYWDFNDGSSLTAHIDATHKSGYYVDVQRFTGVYGAGYTLWNAHLTYNSGSGKWSLSAYVNNISNHPVLLQANPAGPGFYSMFGDPRTYGLSFNVHLF